jgi:hypothetical protein
VSSLPPRSARWARLGRRRPLPSETRASADRPRGYKVARLVADPRTFGGSFLGLTVGGLYTSEGTASCEVLDGALPPPRRWGRRRPPPPHLAPDLGCSCGFYAFARRTAAAELLASRPPVSRLFGTALLEVDLAGTVIEFDRGYRSGQQRVLGVQVPQLCLPCAADGEVQPARRLAGLAGRLLERGLQDEVPRLSSAYRLALAVHHASLLQRLAGRAALRPVCDDHTLVPDATTEWRADELLVLELADLAARLGTEVRWLDHERFDVFGFVEAVSWRPPAHRSVA